MIATPWNDPVAVSCGPVGDRDVHPVLAAQQAATGAFANSGQVCVAVERIYVHEAIAAPFTTPELPSMDGRVRLITAKYARATAAAPANGAAVMEPPD